MAPSCWEGERGLLSHRAWKQISQPQQGVFMCVCVWEIVCVKGSVYFTLTSPTSLQRIKER